MSSGQSGSATTDEKNSASLSQLISTLVPVLVVAIVYVTLWLFLRPKLVRNYEPRSFVGSLREQERTPPLPKGWFNWIKPFQALPDSFVLNHHSLDGFLFLRYLKISVVICLVGCFITWPVLFPVSATGGGGAKQLDMLAYGNVQNDKKYRLFAHTFVAWIFFSFVFYMVARESIFYINLRQAYLLSPLYSRRISSRTVLFTAVPKEYQDDAKLRKLFGPSVKNLWIANETKELEELVTERNKVALKLEAAETKLIKLANANRLKTAKKGTQIEPVVEPPQADVEGESGSVASRWVQPKQRPTHRLKPIIGKKVDTINWCRSELASLIPKVQAAQAKVRDGQANKEGSVFVEFFTQNEAQAAYQSLAHHQPLQMSPRYIGINPDEVIWSNLKITWLGLVIRNIATTAFVSALIIFWAIPVAFCGAISNISSLSQPGPNGEPPKLPWLSFINDIPDKILGLVQGLLPTILLSILMNVLLPMILRLMAKLAGKPSNSTVELRVQNVFFVFQVVQVFLVTTVASSAAAVVVQISRDPSSALSLLSENLPKASNFYISYFVLQGLAISSAAILQLVGVILFRVLGKFLDSTPRKIYTRFVTLAGLGWGTLFPIYTLLTVIALTYSIIAPLVLGFATVGLYLIYLAFRYNLLFVYNTTIDTKGRVYPRALQQTTTGVYLAMFCLIGLFAVSTAWGPLVLMIAYAIFAILFHISLNGAIGPMLDALPKSLQVEEESLQLLEDGQHNGVHTKSEVTDSSLSDTPNGTKGAAPHKKPNLFTKFFAPHVYTDYHTLRRLVPTSFAEITYDPETERTAYYNPAVSSPTPLIWIPRDEMGVSRQEVSHTARVIPITDEQAGFNEKGGLVWDQDSGLKAPIWQEKVYY